jgi:hypothetical protein
MSGDYAYLPSGYQSELQRQPQHDFKALKVVNNRSAETSFR